MVDLQRTPARARGRRGSSTLSKLHQSNLVLRSLINFSKQTNEAVVEMIHSQSGGRCININKDSSGGGTNTPLHSCEQLTAVQNETYWKKPLHATIPPDNLIGLEGR